MHILRLLVHEIFSTMMKILHVEYYLGGKFPSIEVCNHSEVVMKLTQKTKYFIFGVVATAVLIPLGSYAVKTIPLTFAEGDVLSASVLNSLMNRIENATSSLISDDLVGTWTITQIVPYDGQPGNGSCRTSNSCNITGTTDASDGMTRSRSDTVTISKSGNAYNFSQANVSSFVSAHTNTASTGNLSVLAETVIFKNNSGGYSYYYAKKKSSEKIVLQDIQSGSGSFNIIVLDRKNTPPAPAEALSATVNSSGGVALTWTDQSTDETGFKVQYKTSTKGSWTTATTTASNSTSYTLNGLSAGTYWIRVVAANSYGDAMSSSEVQAVVTTTSTFTSTTTSSIMTSTTTSSISSGRCIANC